MKRKGMFIILAAFIALTVSFGSVMTNSAYAADEVIKWKCVAHWPMASSSYKGSLLAIAERLKKRTNGRLIIEPHPGGALVPAKEEFNAVKRGADWCHFRGLSPLSSPPNECGLRTAAEFWRRVGSGLLLSMARFRTDAEG